MDSILILSLAVLIIAGKKKDSLRSPLQERLDMNYIASMFNIDGSTENEIRSWVEMTTSYYTEEIYEVLKTLRSGIRKLTIVFFLSAIVFSTTTIRSAIISKYITSQILNK